MLFISPTSRFKCLNQNHWESNSIEKSNHTEGMCMRFGQRELQIFFRHEI